MTGCRGSAASQQHSIPRSSSQQRLHAPCISHGIAPPFTPLLALPPLPLQYKSAANPHYLTIVQRDFNSHKRLVLVDWMIEVVDEFRLRQVGTSAWWGQRHAAAGRGSAVGMQPGAVGGGV